MGMAAVVRRGVPIVAMTAAVAVVAAYAVLAVGNSVQRPELNNSGIWASNDLEQQVGRFNKSAVAFEKALVAPQSGVDVYQDGNTVVAQSAGSLIAVDSVLDVLVADKPLLLPVSHQVELRGGTLAVLDRAAGKVWAVRANGQAAAVDLGLLAADATPVAEAGGGASSAISVAADGSIVLVSTNGVAVRVPVVGVGFGVPVKSSGPVLRSDVQVAALGSQWVVFDPVTGVLYLPGGATAQVPGSDEQALIQSGGVDTGSVLVATTTSLVSVGFNGEVTTLFDRAGGRPAAPVVLGGYSYGAWAGDPGTVVFAQGGQSAVQVVVDTSQSHGTALLTDPVFRVSWGRLLVNDRHDGRLFDIDLQMSVDNWADVDPEKDQQAKDNKEEENSKPTNLAPQANPDSYSIREARTSVLHVLDNDTDPNGVPLSIASIDGGSEGGTTAAISPDGQTILFTQPKGGADATFQYTIENMARKTVSASVTLKAAGSGENQVPHLRQGFTATTYQVASGGNLQLAVADDFRDDDCDPVTVYSATANSGLVSVSAEGLIEFSAPVVEDSQKLVIEFQVTDGVNAGAGPVLVPGSVEVNVVGAKEVRGQAPVAFDDVVRGEAGTPITIFPLANDLPGVDPANPQQKLSLAGDVKGPPGATVERDGDRLTLLTDAPGVIRLDYVAAFGSAPTASARIRVDVVAKQEGKAVPVTVPDVAVVHGQAPAMVDVLANDFDPRGGLLTVQTATAADPELLNIGIVEGRWVRIVPNQASLAENPTSVVYEVTNGDGAYVSGSVTVTQLPTSEDDAPLLRDDFADVRAGDSVLVAVLANDASANGSQLSLVTNDVSRQGTAGTLRVIDPSVPDGKDPGDIGSAYVSGSSVRYVAPAAGTVTSPKQLLVTYLVQAAGGPTATASLTVTVHPEPSEANPNSPPNPTTVEARVVLGDTKTIQIPSSGQDPDGDSVVLVGIASAPSHGRVLSFTPDGIQYQAYPDDDMAGTDEFRYVLADRFGQTGVGTIRVSVVPPGQTQPPMTVDDEVTARPGITVSVDALSNDFIAAGDPVVISAVTEPGTLVDKQGPVTVVAPPAADPALVVQYTLTGNSDSASVGKITVTGQDGFINPPHINDQVAATADDKVASVDVLRDAWDPDSPMSGLRVEVLNYPAASVSGSVVSVPVTEQAQILSYRVSDPDGGQAAALIFVPAVGDGLPYATGQIEIPQNGTMSIQLADYVKSPRKQPVRITTDDTLGVTPSHLEVQADSLTSFTLTAKDDYVGPASVTLEVTDGADLADGSGQVATVSIPVQVGPTTPVLHCPQVEQTVQIGQDGKTIDLTSLCHVWTAPGEDRSALTYTATWLPDQQPASVDVVASPDKRGIQLSARGDAVPNAKGALSVTIDGTQAKPGTIPVSVTDARKPTIDPISATVQAGQTASGKIMLTSPFDVAHGRQDTIVSIVPKAPTRAADATVTGSGTDTWSVTPAGTFDGTLSYQMTVSDVADTARVNRHQTTTLTVTVYNVPDTPSAPVPGKTVQSHTATLTWAAPNDNGATITKYTLATEDESKTWTCASTSCVADGLENVTTYRFKVKATNKAGDGLWSDLSVGVKPDQKPSQVTGFETSNPRDGAITLSWTAVTQAACDCDVSQLTYTITWPGGSIDNVSGTTRTLTGLSNTETTFTIWAVNGQGRSDKAATTKGWPSGPPGAFTVNNPAPANLDTDRTAVTISWAAAFANGETPVKYWVTDNGTPLGSCQGITATTCKDDSVALGSGKHTYAVTAKNAPAQYSTTASVSWEAEGTPPKLAAPTATPTGADQMIQVSGTTPVSRGPAGKSYVEVLVGGAKLASVAVDSSGGSYSTTVKSPSANGTAVNVTTRLCYTSNADGSAKCGGTSTATQVTPFGPLGNITLTANNNNNVLNVTATANANGAPATLTLTHNGTEPQCKTSSTGSATVTITCSVTIRWSDSRDFSATFTSANTTPSRANQNKSATARGTTPTPPDMELAGVTVQDIGGGVLRVNVTANGHGLGAKLRLTGTGCDVNKESTGWMEATCDANVGYSSGTKTYTATLTNTDTNSTRTEKQKSGSGGTGAEPKWVNLEQTSASTTKISWGGIYGSHQINIYNNGIWVGCVFDTGTTTQCLSYYNMGGSGSRTDSGWETQAGRRIKVVIDGVSSNEITWWR